MVHVLLIHCGKVLECLPEGLLISVEHCLCLGLTVEGLDLFPLNLFVSLLVLVLSHEVDHLVLNLLLLSFLHLFHLPLDLLCLLLLLSPLHKFLLQLLFLLLEEILCVLLFAQLLDELAFFLLSQLLGFFLFFLALCLVNEESLPVVLLPGLAHISLLLIFFLFI